MKMCLNETYTKVCIGEQLYDTLEYTVRKVQEGHRGWKLVGHFSIWSMLLMIIYLAKEINYLKNRSSVSY
jgi:hypothetical protein